MELPRTLGRPNMQAIPDNLDYSQAEHICLEADSQESVSESVTEAVEYRLQLSRPTHGSVHNIAIYNSGRIDVDFSKRKAAPQSYRLHARNLDAHPEVSRHVAKRCLLTALVTGTVAATLLVLPLWFGPFGPWQLPAGILLATASLFALLLGVYRTGESVSFSSQHGRVPVLTIHGGIRCRKRCEALFQRLAQVTAAVRSEVDIAQLLREEMREHHRLKLEGIIEDEDYEAAKLRILSAHG